MREMCNHCAICNARMITTSAGTFCPYCGWKEGMAIPTAMQDCQSVEVQLTEKDKQIQELKELIKKFDNIAEAAAQCWHCWDEFLAYWLHTTKDERQPDEEENYLKAFDKFVRPFRDAIEQYAGKNAYYLGKINRKFKQEGEKDE